MKVFVAIFGNAIYRGGVDVEDDGTYNSMALSSFLILVYAVILIHNAGTRILYVFHTTITIMIVTMFIIQVAVLLHPLLHRCTRKDDDTTTTVTTMVVDSCESYDYQYSGYPPVYSQASQPAGVYRGSGRAYRGVVATMMRMTYSPC